MISSGYSQATSSTGEFIFTSYCVCSGFEFKDFEMLRIDSSLRPVKPIQELI